MKVLSILCLISVSLLCSGQGKRLTIMNFGLCNVKNGECIKQSDGKSGVEWPSGSIELSSPKMKIYYSGDNKVTLEADITLTETIYSSNSYGIFKGTQEIAGYNTSIEVIVRFEYPTENYNRTVIYYYNPRSDLGHYYICRSQ